MDDLPLVPICDFASNAFDVTILIELNAKGCLLGCRPDPPTVAVASVQSLLALSAATGSGSLSFLQGARGLLHYCTHGASLTKQLPKPVRGSAPKTPEFIALVFQRE